MPNHITNVLEFSGKPEDIQKVKDLIRSKDGNDETAIDFNKLIPMPKSLDILSGSRSDDAYAYYMAKTFGATVPEKWSGAFGKSANQIIARVEDRYKENLEDLLKLGYTVSENIRKFKHRDWYDWSCANWGTKWNAYSVTEDESRIVFDTAWSFPEPVMEALAKLCFEHHVGFLCRWADEDTGCNTGYFETCDNEDEPTWDICRYDNNSNEAFETYVACKGESDCIGKDEDGNWHCYECGDTCPNAKRCGI